MGMVTIPRMALGHAGQIGHENLGTQTVVLSSASHYFGAYLYANRASAIRRIGFHVSALSGGPTFRIALEGFSTGNTSDNVVKGGGSPASVSTTVSTGWNWVTLDNDYTPVLGEILVPVIRYVSGATSGTFTRHGLAAYDHLPHGFYNSGAATADHYMPNIAIEYSDGTLVPGTLGITSATTAGFNTGSTPDERGILITAPCTCRVVGAYVQAIGSNASADLQVKFYDSSNTILGSATHDSTLQGSFDNFSGILVWWTPFTITRGETYRMTALPTTANNVNIQVLTFASSALRESAGCAFGYTSRSDAGSWSNDSTIGLIFHPIIDQIESGEASFTFGS
jgi:hypothetical protein